MEINIRVEGDSEGFVEFECPFCNSEFKLNTQEYNDDESKNLFCPYCGLEDEKNKFYTSEIIEQANNIATNYLYEEINKVFGKMSKSFNKNKMIQVKYRPLKKINIKDIKTEDTAEEQFECNNCNKHMKVLYCAGKSKIFCTYCGEDI